MLQKHVDGINAKVGNAPMAWDDVNGGNKLDYQGVIEARKAEMEYFDNMQVYERFDRSEMDRTRGKLIDTRWLDTNKSDEANPLYRSRLVGREFNTHKDDSLYAATPPLEALRLITSWAATIDEEGKGHCHEVMINDVSRAYFYATAVRNILVEIPKEDPHKKP